MELWSDMGLITLVSVTGRCARLIFKQQVLFKDDKSGDIASISGLITIEQIKSLSRSFLGGNLIIDMVGNKKYVSHFQPRLFRKFKQIKFVFCHDGFISFGTHLLWCFFVCFFNFHAWRLSYMKHYFTLSSALLCTF